MGKDWDNPDTFPLRDRGERLTGSGNPTVSRGFANNVHIDNSKRARDGFIAFLTEVMTEALRVLKPGGHALIWSLPRTSHWTATALEDAGFEIRDVITHLFGSGFPKSLDISKAIDRMQGAEREVVGHLHTHDIRNNRENVKFDGESMFTGATKAKYIDHNITAPATPEAQQWAGYGSALKPAAEFWWLCRKPLAESSIAAQVLATGTGGLNIGQCRVGLNGMEDHKTAGSGTLGGHGIYGTANEALNSKQVARAEQGLNPRYDPQGRFPSHLLLSHSPLCKVRIQDVENTAPNGVNVPIVKDAKNVQTDLSKVGVDVPIPSNDALPVMPLSSINLKNNISLWDQEVNDEATVGSGSSILMDEVDTSTPHSISYSELNNGNTTGFTVSVSSPSMNGHLNGVTLPTNDLTVDRAVDAPVSPIDTGLVSSELLITDGASESNFSRTSTTSEYIGTFTGASDTVIGTQSGISHTIDGSTNGTSSIMPGHSSDLHSDDIHYTTLQPNVQQTVEAWECSPDCPIAELDRQSGVRKSGGGVKAKAGSSIGFLRGEEAYHFRHDNPTSYEASEGGASRYFQLFPPDDYTPFLYQSKASRAERNKGCEDLPEMKKVGTYDERPSGNFHERLDRNKQQYQLRSDLTLEQRDYVEAELAKIGGAI